MKRTEKILFLAVFCSWATLSVINDPGLVFYALAMIGSCSVGIGVYKCLSNN